MNTVRKGRGRAMTSTKLIEAMVEIAKGIQPCSVRALAYQLFNRKLIPSMALENTKKVSRLSVQAREEGVLPWSWIVDSTRQEETVATWSDPAEFAITVQRSYRKNKWEAQPKHIVVWSEKSTVEGTLRPILREYEVPFQVMHGYSGATPIMDAVQANRRREQSTLILYVGDYDPSGMGMSEMDLPKRLARYSSKDPSDKDWSPNQVADMLERSGMELRRIALTEEHTQLLGDDVRFPTADKKDDTRCRWFESNFGFSCWELDALSPNQLRECVKDAILEELDTESWNRYVRIEELERAAIVDACRNWKNIIDQDPE